MEEYTREPCPWRIVDDCGGAFTMGLIGGGVFQSIKGFRNAPSGINKRLVSCFRFMSNLFGWYTTNEAKTLYHSVMMKLFITLC